MRILWRGLAVLAVLSVALAQTLIVTPADITGTSAAVAISSSGVARWVAIKSSETNSTSTCSTSSTAGCVHVGDSNVSTVRGFSILPGASMFYPFVPAGQPGYDMTKIYVYAVTGEKVQITWAK